MRVPPLDFPLVNETSVCSSAPGKVILLGEHAVVYGHPAVAASLSDLCVNVLLTPTGSGRLRVSLEDLDIYIDLSAQALVSLQDRIQTPPTAKCADLLAATVLHDHETHYSDSKLMISAITPLLYLILVILSSDDIRCGLDIQVRSRSLPVGAGLGSSAAFSTAVTAALVQVSSPTHPRTLGVPDATTLQRIEQFAYYSEQLLHGTPSGIDNAVSAHGGAMLFQRNADQSTSFTPLTNVQLPSMLLLNTHIPRSTKQLVANVRDLASRHTCVPTILQAMGQLASDFATDSSRFIEQMQLNQCLLQAVGVSHPAIDAICRIVSDMRNDGTSSSDAATAAGAVTAAAKLTGAGGGGCVLVACNNETDGASMEAALTTQFPTVTLFRTQVGGPGVRYIPVAQFLQDTTQNRATDDGGRVRRLRQASLFAILVLGALVSNRWIRRRQGT